MSIHKELPAYRHTISPFPLHSVTWLHGSVFELKTFLLWRIHCCSSSQPPGWTSLSPADELPVKPLFA